MKPCLVCGSPSCEPLIDFGDQPICHHFLKLGETEDRHPLALGRCPRCGVVQAMSPIPPQKLVPRFDWITYNEPEGHLDAVVERLRSLPGISPASTIAGLSYKEDSTLARFRRLGYERTWRADSHADLGIVDAKAGIEMVQGSLSPGVVSALQQKYASPDLMIVRHVLEHTHEPRRFLEALGRLVKPGGYVVFEVPDCGRAFELLDYTTLWEDHNLYFVEQTFLRTLRQGGCEVVDFTLHRAAYENCLVAVTQWKGNGGPAGQPAGREEAVAPQRFAAGFQARRQALRRKLELARRSGKIALFGAGHQAVMYINLMEVADLIEAVLDDNPLKKGLHLPGSRLPIRSSEELRLGEIKLCLSSLSAESERKVLEKHRYFVEQGGAFASIFPIQPGALWNLVAGTEPGV